MRVAHPGSLVGWHPSTTFGERVENGSHDGHFRARLTCQWDTIQSSAFPSASMLRDDGCPSSLTLRATLMIRGPCWLRTDSSVTQKESQWWLNYCHFEVVLLLRHSLVYSDWYSLSIVLCEKELLIFVKVSSHFLSSRQLSWPWKPGRVDDPEHKQPLCIHMGPAQQILCKLFKSIEHLKFCLDLPYHP